MDPVYYKAAIEGNMEQFQNYPNPLNQLLTPNENTILHVHLTKPSANSADFVNKILDMCPSLLLKSNKDGETPLHIAAEHGHYEAVEILINRAKALQSDPERGTVTEVMQMLRTTTKPETETALHKAARYNHLNVVRLLIKEDDEFPYPGNGCGETPLYIAVSKGYFAEILDNCKAVDYGGPRGRSALHAAVINNHHEIAVKLLDKKANLIKQTDDNNWTPLHYAAYCGFDDMTTLLLSSDASLAHVGDNDRNRTAFHIAAMRGRVTLMQLFEPFCPDCHEHVDNRGWNALHYVVASKDADAFSKSVESEWLRGLINKRNNQGHTPLHLFVAFFGYLPSFMCKGDFKSEVSIHVLDSQDLSVGDLLSGKFREKQEAITESLKDIGAEPFTEFDIEPWEQKKQDEEMQNFVDGVDKARESHLVAATLIATVTFAAVFTLPGGYKSDNPNKGTALLIKNAAFIIFILSDVLAMAYSASAVFLHCLMALHPKDWRNIKKLFPLATESVIAAMIYFTIAFTAGLYTVLYPSSGLAITICVIGWCFYGSLYCLTPQVMKSSLTSLESPWKPLYTSLRARRRSYG